MGYRKTKTSFSAQRRSRWHDWDKEEPYREILIFVSHEVLSNLLFKEKWKRFNAGMAYSTKAGICVQGGCYFTQHFRNEKNALSLQAEAARQPHAVRGQHYTVTLLPHFCSEHFIYITSINPYNNPMRDYDPHFVVNEIKLSNLTNII